MQPDILPAAIHCNITDIQTITFPIPQDILTLGNRRFFVSVSDGRITRDTKAVLLNKQPLHWAEILDGFIVDSSSQITLNIFEKHDIRKNNLLGTFVVPYEVLCSCRKVLIPCIHNSKKKKTPSREISVAWSESRIPLAELECEHVSCSSTNTVKETPTRLQIITAEAVKINDPELAVGIFGVSDRVLDTRKAIPSIEFLSKCKIVSDRLGFVVRAVDAIAEVHPYAKIAWSVISFIPARISEQIQLDTDIFVLLDEIELALDLAPHADGLRSRCQKSDRHGKTLSRLLEQIAECGHFIQSYMKDVNFGKRLLKNLLIDGKTVVDNFRQMLRKLREDFVNEVIFSVETSVFRVLAEVESMGENVRALGKDVNQIKENVKEFDLNLKLQKLPYGQGTDFNPERRCLPQTRVKILDQITNWLNDPSSPQVLMLFGQAGTGKSSIAHEIARRFRSLDRLTTSYRFVRGKPSSRDCYRVFTTLALNLCDKYPTFRMALSKAINNNPGLVEMQSYTTLFDSLLRDPLKDVRFVGPVLIVIDALDESEDASEMGRHDTLAFHDFLATRLGDLPSAFRILITSRPEPDLKKAFSESPFVRRMYMNDSMFTAGLDDDILVYVRTKLSKVKGVTEDDLVKLVKKAEGNFQWVFVACSHIARPPSGLDSRRCIQRVLQPTVANPAIALHPLDELYTTILKRFDMNDHDVRDNFKSVMGQILCAFEPVSVDALDVFVSSKDDPPNVFAIVEDLGSLLSHVTLPGSGLPVAPLHTSFRDFLTDKSRSRDFHVNLGTAHEEFALATLRTMQQELKFNICKLETSYLLNSEVPDLQTRVEDNIPSALSYSCRFWADHLACVPTFNSDVFEGLYAFMKEKLLFWLEVLSLRGELAIAKPALLSLLRWIKNVHDKVEIEEIEELAKDAIAFVCYFGYPISRSTPHIYLSALPFSPSSSVLSNLYTPRFNTLRLEYGRLAKWPALEMMIPVPGRGEVQCVVWSRDGDYIAARVDSDVYVWSTSTGMVVSGPIHDKDGVESIAFSDDGQRLALGICDGGIWIWDVVTGTQTELRGPWTLDWPQKGVSAVAFGQGGKQLVLGLGDSRVFVWDLEKAEVVGEPFIGHNNLVWAVSFLDPEHIVSRSGFRTVHVWNVKTRERVTRMNVATGTLDTAVHHTKYFIPDRSRVNSSFDACLWTDATEGEGKYRVDGLWSDWRPAAAFSPDGKLVATCSPDHVHVRFAMGRMAGRLAGGPFNNEGGKCLAFSADGRIASGTSNGTLRVWNVQLVEDGSGSSNPRTPWSVAFMPDCEQIVVGWRDGEVSALDGSTGQGEVRIAEGDEGNNWTLVAVSPNGDCIASARDDKLFTWTRNGVAVAGPLKSCDHEPIWSLAFSPNANHLVAYGTYSGTVCVLNASTGILVAGPKKFTSTVTSLAISPSIHGSTMNTRVAVGVRDEIYIWDTHIGNTDGPFTHQCNPNIYALVFSSDGKFLTSAATDYTLRVWDGKTMRESVDFRHHQAVVLYGRTPTRRVSLTHGGRRVVFMGINNTILLFDVLYTGGAGVVTTSSVLPGHPRPLNFFGFSQDGQYLATPSDDRTIRIWDLQAILGHKQRLDVLPDDSVVDLDETWIDDVGWAGCANGEGGNPPLRRLIWVPDAHRIGLRRSCNVRVVSGQLKETRLDLENFVHGKNWVKCWLGSEFETFCHPVY